MKKAVIAASLFTLLSFADRSNDPLSESVRSLMKEASGKEVFSGNVLIAENGNEIFKESIGYADEEGKVSNDENTMFETGSITKFFTKVVMHQLVSEGKLDPDDKIMKYFPDFTDPAAGEITIRHLIDHQSGLGDFFRDGNPGMFAKVKEISDVLPEILKSRLAFIPGSKVQYSNSGYVVLGALIEKIEGKKLKEIFGERIFDRLGMDRSGFDVRVTEREGKAKGYLSNQLGLKEDNSMFPLIGAGAGGVYSSTGDMFKFAYSLLNDTRLLDVREKLKLFNTPLLKTNYESWEDFLNRGKFTIAGGAPGISAVLSIDNEKKFIIVVLSNFDEGTAEDLFRRVNGLMNGKEPEPFNPPPARIIYDLVKEKNGEELLNNYKQELSAAGIPMDNDMLFLFAGQEFLREKDADNAIELYTIVTKEFPEIVVGWNDMGDAYLLKGDKENARKCFEQALKLRPQNQRAKASLEKL